MAKNNLWDLDSGQDFIGPVQGDDPRFNDTFDSDFDPFGGAVVYEEPLFPNSPAVEGPQFSPFIDDIPQGLPVLDETIDAFPDSPTIGPQFSPFIDDIPPSDIVGLPTLDDNFEGPAAPTLAQLRDDYHRQASPEGFVEPVFEDSFINRLDDDFDDFVDDSGAVAEYRQLRDEGGFFDTSDFGGDERDFLGAAQSAASTVGDFVDDPFINPLIQAGAIAVGGAAGALGELASTGISGDIASVPIEILDEISMASELATSVLRETSIAGDDQTFGSRVWVGAERLMELSSGDVGLSDVLRVAGQMFTAKQMLDDVAAGEEVDLRDLANVVSLDPALASHYSDINVPSGHAAWQAVTGGPQAVADAYERIENKDAIIAEKEERANALAVIAEDPTADQEIRDAAALARAQIGAEIVEEGNKSASDIANEHTSFGGDLLFDLVFDVGIVLDKFTDVLSIGAKSTQAARAQRKAAAVVDSGNVARAADTTATSVVDLLNNLVAKTQSAAEAGEIAGSKARQADGWSIQRLVNELNPANRLASGLVEESVDGLAFTMSAILNGVESRKEAANLLRMLADNPTQFIGDGLSLADLPSRAAVFDGAEDVYRFAESTIANTGFVNNYEVLVEASKRTFDAGDWVDNIKAVSGDGPLAMRELQSELFETLRYAANDIYGVSQRGGLFEHSPAGKVALKTLASTKKLISELNLFSRPAYTVNNAISGNVFLADDGLLSWNSFDDLTGKMAGWFGPDSAITGRLGDSIGTITDEVVRTATGELVGESGESIFRNLTLGYQNPLAWWVEKGIAISQGTGGIGNLPVGEQRMYLTAFANGMEQALHRQVGTLGDKILASLPDIPEAMQNLIRNELAMLPSGADTMDSVTGRINEALTSGANSFPWRESGLTLDNIPLPIADELNRMVRDGVDSGTLINRVTEMVQGRVDEIGKQMLANPPSYTESNLFDMNLLQDATSTLDELTYAAQKAGIPPLPPEEVQRINTLFDGIQTGMTDLLRNTDNMDVVFDSYQDILAKMDEVRRLTDVSAEQAQRGERAWDVHYSAINDAWAEANESITDIYANAADATRDYQRRYTSAQDDRIAELLVADDRELRTAIEAGVRGTDEQFRQGLEAQRLVVDRARYTAFQAVRESLDMEAFNVLTSTNRMVENLNAHTVAWRNHIYEQYKSGTMSFGEFRKDIGDLWRERADLAEWMWANSAREIVVRHGESGLETGVLFKVDGDELELLRPLSSEVDGWVVRNPDGGQGIIAGSEIPVSAKSEWAGIDIDWGEEGEKLQRYSDGYQPSGNGYQPLVFDEPQDIILPDDPLQVDDLLGIPLDNDIRRRGLAVLSGDGGPTALGPLAVNPPQQPALTPVAELEPPAWLNIDEYISDTPLPPPDNSVVRMADHDPANTLFDRERVNNQRYQGVNGPDVGDMSSHIRTELDRLVDYVRKNADDILTPTDTGYGALTGQDRLNIRSRIREGLDAWQTALLTASQEAVNRADFNMVNYAKTRNIDAVMSVISPWSYWSTRTMTSYAERMLNHPRLLTMNQSVDRNMKRENDNRGVNKWHEGTLPNPFPFGPERLRDPRFSAFPTEGLYVKEARDVEQTAGGEDRYGSVTPVMNEINRWFGTSPYVEYAADVANNVKTDGLQPKDLSPYNYVWPLKTGGLILSAAGITHEGGSDNLASNIIEEMVASGEIDINTAQYIQHYMLTGEIPSEAHRLGLDLPAMSEDARREASRRKLAGASGIGTLAPIGGYYDDEASQSLRQANTDYRALTFDPDGNVHGSDAGRDEFLEDNPAILSVFTGSQLSPTFQRGEGDRFPAAIASDRNTFDLRDTVTREMFDLQSAAKDAAILANPDITSSEINQAGSDAVRASALERIGPFELEAFERTHKGYSAKELIDYTWNTLADRQFPSRTQDLTPPEFTGLGYAPYELDERDFNELLRDFTQFKRPDFPEGEEPTSEQWDTYRSGMEDRYRAQLAVAQKYINDATGHELRIINGRTAAELVEAGDNRYRTDLEVERRQEIQAEGERNHKHWEQFLSLNEEDWDGRRAYISANPDFEAMLQKKAIAEQTDFWWREGDSRHNPNAIRTATQQHWKDFSEIDGDDFDGKRAYIAANPDFEKLLSAKAHSEGKRLWWKDSEHWGNLFAYDENDWDGKRAYIAANPDFEKLLRDKADSEGKPYWWASQGGSNPLWAAYLSIDGDDFDAKKAYIAANPEFEELLTVQSAAAGKGRWWLGEGTSSPLWEEYLKINGEDFDAKKSYIAANPEFEAILTAKAKENGTPRWWLGERGNSEKAILWQDYLAIDGEDFDSKKAYISANPKFEAILKEKADKDGKPYWWLQERSKGGRRDFGSRSRGGSKFNRSGLSAGQRRLALKNGRDIVTDSRAESRLVQALERASDKCAFLQKNQALLALFERNYGEDRWWEASIEDGGYGCGPAALRTGSTI